MAHIGSSICSVKKYLEEKKNKIKKKIPGYGQHTESVGRQS